jgi:putative transposase
MRSARQTELIRKTLEDSGKNYGYQKLHNDLLEQGVIFCLRRVFRLAKLVGIKEAIGYKRRPSTIGGNASVINDNTLNQQLDVDTSDRAKVNSTTVH